MNQKDFDILTYNRKAWNSEVKKENKWTVPVSPEVIEAARRGEWEVVLTPEIPVPRSWFPEEVSGLKILGLASGGGQQAPILAALGADVTVLDNSPGQLEQDQIVARREGLSIRSVQGDMRDLSVFEDESFDLIFHPCSNVFVPDVRPVWKEAFRVLKPGGSLLSGMSNPVVWIFPDESEKADPLKVKYSIPYSDLTSLSPEELKRYMEEDDPLCFGHSLDDLIGGQLDAGFLMGGFFEDRRKESVLDQYIPTYLATRAIKPRR